MTAINEECVVTDFYCFQYTMPLKTGFKTSRHVTKKSRNLILVAVASVQERQFVAIGEASPRSLALTGDTLSMALEFCMSAGAHIRGLRIPVGDEQATLERVREIMSDLEALAASSATDENRSHPFRGALSGLDMLLLDLASKANGLPLADFLGRKRDHVPVTATTMSVSKGDPERRKRNVMLHLKRYPAVRVKGDASTDDNISFLKLVSHLNNEKGTEAIAWMDLNEAYTPIGAADLIARIVAAARQGDVSGAIIIEQPVPRARYGELCELQRLARQSTTGLNVEITMLADESLWDLADLRKLQACGGVGAINIKIQKCGGILRGLELASEALKFDPDTKIYLGGMIGTSDFTSRALLSMGAVLPRFDYITSGPKSNIDAHIIENPLKWQDSTNVLPFPATPGVGGDIDWAQLARYVPEDSRQGIPFFSESDD